MTNVTKSIGTASRDYSTVALWESDLDNAGVYGSGDNAIGECYADSTFNETVNINGGGTIGLASVKLSVNSAERHDGTAGTGVRIITTSSRTTFIQLSTSNVSISWIEIDGSRDGGFLCRVAVNISIAGTITHSMLIHDFYDYISAVLGINPTTLVGDTTAFNNIVYDLQGDAGSNHAGMNAYTATNNRYFYNNTIYKVIRAAGGTFAKGIWGNNKTSEYLRNNISLGCDTDFQNCNATNCSNNLSSDSTAPGSNSIKDKDTSNQFVSIVDGSEDLHLKKGSDAIQAGTDLGTTNDVNIDINGFDRDTMDPLLSWDIGAHQYSTAIISSGDIGKYLPSFVPKFIPKYIPKL